MWLGITTVAGREMSSALGATTCYDYCCLGTQQMFQEIWILRRIIICLSYLSTGRYASFYSQILQSNKLHVLDGWGSGMRDPWPYKLDSKG